MLVINVVDTQALTVLRILKSHILKTLRKTPVGVSEIKTNRLQILRRFLILNAMGV